MTLFLALVADVAHAVPEGSHEALCGTPVTTTTARAFPGGASAVCRDCSRASAVASSTVPLRASGARKRPGGM
jgi:hypothetical protein